MVVQMQNPPPHDSIGRVTNDVQVKTIKACAERLVLAAGDHHPIAAAALMFEANLLNEMAQEFQKEFERTHDQPR